MLKSPCSVAPCMSHHALLGHVEVPVTFSKDDAVGIMQDAGVVGAGGAGFPTYVKYRTAPRTLLVNAAESEPGYYADKLLLRDEPEALYNLFEWMQEALSIETCVIGAEEVAKPYCTDLEDLCHANEAMSISYFPHEYKYGQEKALAKVVMGLEIPKDKLPGHFGIAVNNVETLFHMYRAIFEERPVVTKFLHLYGEVGEVRVFEAPVGAFATDLMRIYGVDPDDYAHCLLYDGGPILCEPASDGPMGTACEYTVKRNTNGILVVAPDKNRPRKKHYPYPDFVANTIDAPGAPDHIDDISGLIDRVRVPLTGRFWSPGAIHAEVGQKVRVGDCLAEPDIEALSVGVHASIDGRITAVTDDYVEIVS